MENLEEQIAAQGIDSRWEMVWRSALWPGWGHWHGRRNFTGWSYSFFFIGALAAYKVQSDLVKVRNEEIGKSILANLYFKSPEYVQGVIASGQSPTDLPLVHTLGTLDKHAQAKSDRNAIAAFAGGVYLISLLHSYITGTYLEKEALVLQQGESRIYFGFGDEGATDRRNRGIDGTGTNMQANIAWVYAY